jgi:hypothetical protein
MAQPEFELVFGKDAAAGRLATFKTQKHACKHPLLPVGLNLVFTAFGENGRHRRQGRAGVNLKLPDSTLRLPGNGSPQQH